MNVLILTSPEYKQFVVEALSKVGGLTHENVFVDWLNEKFIFVEPLTYWYDVGVSFMYTHKVPAEQVKSKPWFNFHPAPLPNYKGRDLCYHAIMNGEKSFGATVHYMDENFDTGDIIEVAEFDIPDWWTAEDLSGATIEMSKQLFKAYLPAILDNTVFPRHPNRGGTYYKKGHIIEEVPIKPDEPFAKFVRAVTYKDFYPRIDIGGKKYKIVREE